MNVSTGRIASNDTVGNRGGSPSLRGRWQPSRRLLRFRLYAGLMILDLLCIVGSFAAACWGYEGSLRSAWIITPAIVPLYLIAAFSIGAYAASVIDRVSITVGRAARALTFAAAAVLFLAFILRASEDFSRLVFALGIGGSFVALCAVRYVFVRRVARILGGNPYNVVLICDDGHMPLGGSFSMVLATSAFDAAGQDPQMYDRLAQALEQVDRVVVACSVENRAKWVHLLQGANVQAEIVMDELKAFGPRGLDRFGSSPTLVVARGPMSAQGRLLKRLFDITFAGGTLLLLLPVFLLVALAVKLESRGPVFFVQTRIGRANRLFRIRKFRSMRVDQGDAAGNRSAARDDDRITRVGSFIRKTSIDELPQLMNVLDGTMSIVGPRPHALGSKAEDKLFWEIDRRYWHRHAVKPGLTGLAQVRGYRGATNHRSDLTNRLHSDLEYLDNWTIWRDMMIIIKTFGVLVHRNAF
ncbi:exopolysaccharide biosynthesis polyprenyl glycosylphosphotransferase [Sphingomonas silueang]|uniref:exopolysaccharide biosynthesis polyprenyl glycosylphosphotransferase n=1 Tax=Sphingomonas silueang TaxID=3156617 RepID=UPI0032B5CC68